MKFLADECCSVGFVAALRQKGYDIIFVAETFQGISDEQVIAYAFNNRRILITEDKDFGELVYRLAKPAHGIILLRFDSNDPHTKILRAVELLEKYESRLANSFVVVESKKIRIQPLQR